VLRSLKHQAHIAVIPQSQGQILPCLVDCSGSIDRGKKTPGNQDIWGSGKADRYCGPSEERSKAGWRGRIRFQFTTKLSVSGGSFLEVTAQTPSGLLFGCDRVGRRVAPLLRWLYGGIGFCQGISRAAMAAEAMSRKSAARP
jgi:hypothetical protein